MSITTARGAVIGGTLALALVGGAIVGPAQAYAATVMTCHASAPTIGWISNTVLASGQGEGRPGTVAGGSIAVLSERIAEVHIDVAIHRFSVGEQVVASSGHSVDGPPTYFNAHESTFIDDDVKYKGQPVDFSVIYQAVNTVECRSTGGAWKSDTARSKLQEVNAI